MKLENNDSIKSLKKRYLDFKSYHKPKYSNHNIFLSTQQNILFGVRQFFKSCKIFMFVMKNTFRRSKIVFLNQ